MEPYLLSKINPFMAEVAGIQAPDAFSYPTGTAVLRNAATLPNNAGGYLSQIMLPLAADWAYNPLNTTGGTITYAGGGGNNVSQMGALLNVASAYRVVSWGVRITADAAFADVSGHVWVAHVPLNFNATVPYFDFPTTEAGIAGLPLAEKWSISELAQKPLVISGRAVDDGIYRFRDTNYPVNASPYVETNPGWCGILVYVAGGVASKPSINIEHIMHIEYLQDGSTLYDFLESRPGCYQPNVMEKASLLQNGTPVAFLEDAVETFDKVIGMAGNLMARGAKAASIGMQAASIAGKVYGSIRNFARPSRGLAYIEDVD